jgi:TolB protein
MPDVREVFDMATQKVRPDPGATERQHRNQRRRTTRRKVGGYVLAAAIVIAGAVVALATLSGRNHTPQPATHTHHPTPTTSSPAIDSGSGRYGAANSQQVAVVSLGGATVVRVPGLPSDAYGLNLSPDGKTIAFATTHTGTLSSSRIATIGIDGTGLRVFMDTPSTASMPDWSPDGSRIAFQAEGSDGSDDIFTMEANGKDVRTVVSSPGYDREPEWSPDGSLLAYYSGGSGSGYGSNQEIYTVPVAGGASTRLTRNHVADLQPVWSPDGRQIAFVRSEKGRLWVMGADGSHARQLGTAEGQGPQWSPDGTTIATLAFTGRFGRVEFGGATQTAPIMQVRLVNIATGKATDVGSEKVAGFLNQPQWLPSGESLLLNRLRKH